MELLIVIALIAILSAVAIPAYRTYRDRCCLKAAVADICMMIRETKQNALADDRYYAVSFDSGSGRVSLLSGRGADENWNTSDDQVVRSFRLSDKGKGLHFGYGSYGPLPDRAATSDGISFQSNNTLVCNSGLTGNAGAVYISAQSGAAMAIMMNSRDVSYSVWCWTGTKWLRE